MPDVGHTAEVTLAWDPNDEPDIAGYAIHHNIDFSGPPYGYSGAVLIEDLEDPDKPEVTITELEDNTKYYFAITAYDDNGNESGYSDEVCVQVNGGFIEACPASSSVAEESGGGGGGCFITSAAHKQFSFAENDFIQLFLFLFILGIFIRQRL